MDLEHVFTPIRIGSMTVPNRIARTAHGTALGRDGDFQPLIDYHVARARGGIGLAIIEIAGVHPSSPGTIIGWTDEAIAGWEQMAKAMAPYGTKVVQQLFHGGHHILPVDGSPPWSASTVPDPAIGVTPIAMTHDQIAEILASYAATAVRAQAGGFDGVEIHSAHGYLPGQFLSPITNRRDDEYGGPLENRLRFVREVIDAVREATGPDFVVGVRLSSEEGVPGGLAVDDSAEIAKAIEATGKIDYINVSLGGYYRFDKMIGGMNEPRAYEMPKSAPVTAAVSLPTLVTGRFLTLEDAEQVLAAGEADLVSMVRALIADPDLPRKTREGRESEVRPCISCNACVGVVFGPRQRLGCAVNVSAGDEDLFGDAFLEPVASPQSVVVVGGGPCGLEAARTAALLGHRVTLFEAAAELGGQVRYARKAPFHEDVGRIVDFQVSEMDRLDVDVRLGVAADVSSMTDVGADAVILATGSTPRRDGFQARRPGEPVAGTDLPHVYSSWEILSGEATIGERALVLDDTGLYEPIAVAEYLLDQGASVVFATQFPTVGFRIGPVWDLYAKPALERLTGQAFELAARAHLRSIAKGSVELGNLDADGLERKLDIDTVVLASGNDSVRGLEGKLADTGIPVVVVGDALSQRGLMTAIHDGYHAAVGLGQQTGSETPGDEQAVAGLLASQH